MALNEAVCIELRPLPPDRVQSEVARLPEERTTDRVREKGVLVPSQLAAVASEFALLDAEGNRLCLIHGFAVRVGDVQVVQPDAFCENADCPALVVASRLRGRNVVGERDPVKQVRVCPERLPVHSHVRATRSPSVPSPWTWARDAHLIAICVVQEPAYTKYTLLDVSLSATLRSSYVAPLPEGPTVMEPCGGTQRVREVTRLAAHEAKRSESDVRVRIIIRDLR